MWRGFSFPFISHINKKNLSQKIFDFPHFAFIPNKFWNTSIFGLTLFEMANR